MSIDTPLNGSLVPSREVLHGADFVRSLPEVTEAIIRSRENEADRLILTERLTKLPKERKTLDQIASSTKVKMTRERIRQRESKLVSLLVNAFIHGRTRRLGVELRPEFLAYWAIGVQWFGKKEEIRFSEFLSGLQTAWGVSAEDLLPHLPLITAVLTSRATIPEQLRQQMRCDPRYFREIATESRSMPLKSLALGKAFYLLATNGIASVGDFIDLARSGAIPSPTTSVGRSIERVLTALFDARKEDGTVNWYEYENALKLVRLPQLEHASIVEVLDSLQADLSEIVAVNNYSKRANDVFRLRVSAPRSRRPTLAETAVFLNTHGPIIKREESQLLEGLNDQLVDRDFTRSRVAFRSGYLDFWKKADELFRESDREFAAFCALASERFGVSRRLLDGKAELIWAVLNQYPTGRRRRIRQRVVGRDFNQDSASEGIIILRGFRSVH